MDKYALQVSTRHVGYDGPRRVAGDSSSYESNLKFEVVLAQPEK